MKYRPTFKKELNAMVPDSMKQQDFRIEYSSRHYMLVRPLAPTHVLYGQTDEAIKDDLAKWIYLIA
jgi:hypothetical protein